MMHTSRRHFLGGVAGVATATLVSSAWARAAEPRLETATIRITETPEICEERP
jgi:hypothetical protein